MKTTARGLYHLYAFSRRSSSLASVKAGISFSVLPGLHPEFFFPYLPTVLLISINFLCFLLRYARASSTEEEILLPLRLSLSKDCLLAAFPLQPEFLKKSSPSVPSTPSRAPTLLWTNHGDPFLSIIPTSPQQLWSRVEGGPHPSSSPWSSFPRLL